MNLLTVTNSLTVWVRRIWNCEWYLVTFYNINLQLNWKKLFHWVILIKSTENSYLIWSNCWWLHFRWLWRLQIIYVLEVKYVFLITGVCRVPRVMSRDFIVLIRHLFIFTELTFSLFISFNIFTKKFTILSCARLVWLRINIFWQRDSVISWKKYTSTICTNPFGWDN